jgi:hypothetical protein
MAQVVQHLPSKCEVQSSNPSNTKGERERMNDRKEGRKEGRKES